MARRIYSPDSVGSNDGSGERSAHDPASGVGPGTVKRDAAGDAVGDREGSAGMMTRTLGGKARRRSVTRLEIGMRRAGDTAMRQMRMMNVGCADANTVMENVIWFGNQGSRQSENNNERSKETPRIGHRLESRPT
ncbi:hypothetical protein Scep_024716 [Stephania cephalantha]|uniref:Uncharacterized protein n=1 Tax=Stephania cephalantha TaxID=152367 RepID=A0AAP0EX30_9MAGN